MLEQIDSKLEQQGKVIMEIKKLLLEEIELRKQDQLKIAQLENVVTELNTRLEGQLDAAVEDLHDKLDQLEHSLNPHEETRLADMNSLLTQRQNYASVAPPEYTFVETELSQLDIGFRTSHPETSTFIPGAIIEEKQTSTPMGIGGLNEAAGIVQATLTTTINSLARPQGYVNWDHNKHDQLKELKLVKFKKLDRIFNKVLHEEELTPKRMTKARTRITELHVSTVNKYKRFPSAYTFIDINLTSEKNAELKKMFVATDTKTFYDAVIRYKFFIKDNTLDRVVFENIHGLQWVRRGE